MKRLIVFPILSLLFILPAFALHPDRAFLGVESYELTMEKALKLGFENPFGAYISKIIPKSAADRAGLHPFDYIYRIDDQVLSEEAGLEEILAAYQAGDEVTVYFLREGRTDSVVVVLEEQPDPEIQSEDKAFLGIYAELISAEKALKMGLEHHYGTLVTGIIPNTAAEKAGLQLFDYLYGIDAYRSGEGQYFGSILAKYKAGDKATLYFIRRGQSRMADITFGKRPEGLEEMKKMNKCEDTFLGIMSTEDVDPANVEQIRIKPVPNSTAKEMGLQDGDIIKTINGYKMYDWMDIGYVLDNLKVGDPLTVGYERNGVAGKASGKIKSYAATKNCEDCDCDELEEEWEKEIKIAIPEIEIELPGMPRTPKGPAPLPRTDVANMRADIQDPSEAEVRQMNEKATVKLLGGATLSVQDLKLTPIPNEGRFNLTFDLSQRGKTMVRIFNSTGRMIYEYDLGDFSGAFSDQVDISQNGPGTYFLEIRQGERSTVKKIILSWK